MDVMHMRNFKDFLLLYNQISETCFKRCMNTFISRDISFEEDLCVKKCVEKHVHGNHKMMEIFVEVQPVLMQKRIEEIQQTQAALEEQMQKQESEK
ncbi:mitochondrial import inner membrane translocase subunit Tim10B [Halictus rubicundus]|uniref:mitochondrial import inner membrane translocase subunit Tim10B n=1 Tax=Halictus rubicundus TaxID=77578 RepID=UPI004035355E